MENKNQRGQVGIGTLIVFIAMVLVAAIAAGVLINTAGFLQSQSEETGEQSSQQVTDRIAVVSETGTITSNKISDVDLNIKKAPGADDIDVSEATISWIGPGGSADVVNGDAARSLSSVTGTTSVLSEDSNVFTLSLDLDQSPIGRELSPGETASLSITTASGGSTSVELSAPESLSGDSAVSL